MSNHGRVVLACAVTLFTASFFGVSPAHAANAEKEAAGWKNWADAAEKIAANTGAGSFDGAGAGAACKGVTGVVTGQGFQFPYWAQNLIGACKVFGQLEDVNESIGMASTDMRDIYKRKKKSLCKESERIAGELGKAKPVESEPRAQALAFDLAESLGRIYDAADCSGKARTWSWRHEESTIKP